MRKIKLIYPVLLLALMVMIFCFSAQAADDSTETSGHFTSIAAHALISNLDTFDAVTQQQIIDGFSFIVRKAAHFSEYALMGFLWYLWLREKRFAPLIALLATALYACTDEFHQSLIPGRSCELRDVVVDTSGAAAGILCAFILVCVIYCVRRGSIVKWGTWMERKD